MPIPDFVDRWGHLVAENPVPFLALTLIVAAATWWFANARFSGQIDALKAHNSFLDTKLSHLSVANPAPLKPALTVDQYGQIIGHLREYANTYKAEKIEFFRTVYVQVAIGFSENEQFATQLQNALKNAGWHAMFQGPNQDQRCQSGIWIFGSESEGISTRSILKTALACAGFNSQVEEETIGKHPAAFALVVLGNLHHK